MDNCYVAPSSSPYDVLIYSGKRRVAVAQSSVQSSFDQRPSLTNTPEPDGALRNFRFRPPPTKEKKPSQSIPISIPQSDRSETETDTDGTWYTASTSDSKHGFIDLEAGCGTWPGLPRSVPIWRRIWGSMFRSKVEAKIQHPESCRDVDYRVRRGTPLVKFSCWLGVFFVYLGALRALIDSLGFQCAVSEKGLTGDKQVLASLITWASAILGAAAAFLIGQGYFGLRATRERMERVRQTSVTLAYAFIKTAGVPGGGHSRGELPLIVYECLALLTAYPVALLHQAQGNTCEPAVTKYCQQVAYKLKELHDGTRTIVQSPNIIYQSRMARRNPPKQHVRVEFFFELLSLHLEKEFTQHCRKTAGPSLSPQHILYNLRNHFENIVDSRYLDPGRAPIVRENIDMLALAGRECTVYAGCDVVPISMLWTIDLCSRAITLTMPLRHCVWITMTSGWHLTWRMSFLATTCAMVMMVLAEMWSLWDPFGLGMNTFSWTLGIASEIDNMLNEFYESENKVPVREHKFMDVGNSHSDSAFTQTSATRTTRTTRTSSEELSAR